MRRTKQNRSVWIFLGFLLLAGAANLCGRTAVPVWDANATNFSGILGSKWLINGYQSTEYQVFSKFGHLYGDKACTKVIEK